jgi:small subunit ribosomal protein S5
MEEEKIEEELPKVEAVSALEKWKPKTSLGKEVFEGKITDIEEIFKSGRKITEPEIVDKLLPNLKNELILIGGRTGKGGGIQRIPVKITATMHKSGRRFTTNAFVVVGNEDGIVGVGKGSAPETRDAINKAIQKAKLNLIKIKRGCGSFECSCEEPHSIPFKIKGRSGSVRVVLMPAPKGVGLVASDEAKKILRLAGIKDVWLKTFGNTSMRMNLINAIFDALKKLYMYERGE